MLIIFVVIFANDREKNRENNCCAYILVNKKHTIVMNYLFHLRMRNEQFRKHRTCWLLKCIKQWWRFTTRCEWKIRETTRFRIHHVMINSKELFFARNENSSCCSQRASVNKRITIQSSSYELSWTTFTDISSFTTSNKLRMTMSEILRRDTQMLIFDLI
jgi:hypothetical protein